MVPNSYATAAHRSRRSHPHTDSTGAPGTTQVSWDKREIGAATSATFDRRTGYPSWARHGSLALQGILSVQLREMGCIYSKKNVSIVCWANDVPAVPTSLSETSLALRLAVLARAPGARCAIARPDQACSSRPPPPPCRASASARLMARGAGLGRAERGPGLRKESSDARSATRTGWRTTCCSREPGSQSWTSSRG